MTNLFVFNSKSFSINVRSYRFARYLLFASYSHNYFCSISLLPVHQRHFYFYADKMETSKFAFSHTFSLITLIMLFYLFLHHSIPYSHETYNFAAINSSKKVFRNHFRFTFSECNSQSIAFASMQCNATSNL